MVSDIALTSRKESRPVAEDKRKIWTFILNSFKAYEGEAWSRELGKPRSGFNPQGSPSYFGAENHWL